jgi:hypothetical protein
VKDQDDQMIDTTGPAALQKKPEEVGDKSKE